MDEIWLYNQLRLVIYPSIYKVLAPSNRWLFGISEPSTVGWLRGSLTSTNTSVTPKNGHSKHTTHIKCIVFPCQDRPSMEQILTRARQLVTWVNTYTRPKNTWKWTSQKERIRTWKTQHVEVSMSKKKSGESYYEMEKPKLMNVDGTWWSKMKVFSDAKLISIEWG